MSGLLLIVGAIAVAAGAVMIGFGVPINEFSFGNTLIVAGTTATVGGLIIIALGVVVSRLQRVAEALATREPIRSNRPVDMFESVAGSRNAPAPSQIPFPPKPKSDTGIREPQPFEHRAGASPPAATPINESPVPSFAPTLRNPDDAPVTVDDEISLSPHHPLAAPAPGAANPSEPARYTPPSGANGSGMASHRNESTPDAGWRGVPPPAAPPQTRQPHTAYFDAMWPAEAKPAKAPADSDVKPFEPKFDSLPRETTAPPASRAEPEAPKVRPENEPRAVAILKSGVVDGMSYTLYVDGSIEAELPQGTLRFASINELRSHLEKDT
jgi:hypothetical protein